MFSASSSYFSLMYRRNAPLNSNKLLITPPTWTTTTDGWLREIILIEQLLLGMNMRIVVFHHGSALKLQSIAIHLSASILLCQFQLLCKNKLLCNKKQSDGGRERQINFWLERFYGCISMPTKSYRCCCPRQRRRFSEFSDVFSCRGITLCSNS